MASNQAKQQNTERLLSFFERQDDEGLYYYSDEDVRHFLPLLVLTLATEDPDLTWPPAITKLMQEFTRSIDLPDNASAAQLNEAVDAYYKAHPIDKELQNNFQVLVREIVASGSDSAISDAASKLLGMAPATLQPKKPGVQRGESLLSMMLSGAISDNPKDENK